MHRRGFEFDYKFDWILRKAGQKVDPADMASQKWEESKQSAKANKGGVVAERKGSQAP